MFYHKIYSYKLSHAKGFAPQQGAARKRYEQFKTMLPEKN